MRHTILLAQALLFTTGSLVLFPDGPSSHTAFAESLKIDGLPNDPQQYRVQVNQTLTKVDTLIRKLKEDPANQAIVLDLIQTRDNVLREIAKMETKPGDAKWTTPEMRDSVQAMLHLLKDQYEKVAD